MIAAAFISGSHIPNSNVTCLSACPVTVIYFELASAARIIGTDIGDGRCTYHN